MQVWASKPRDMPPKEVGDYARRVEALGYDGLTVSEGVHDGSVNAWAALAATTELRVAVSVFVAFARSRCRSPTPPGTCRTSPVGAS